MSLGNLKTQAITIGTLGAIVMISIAIVQGFKDTNLVDNTTADRFIAGLAVFGTFVGVLALAVVGKAIIGLFKKS